MDRKLMQALFEAEKIILNPQSTPLDIERAILHVDRFNDPAASRAIRHTAGEATSEHHGKLT